MAKLPELVVAGIPVGFGGDFNNMIGRASIFDNGRIVIQISEKRNAEIMSFFLANQVVEMNLGLCYIPAVKLVNEGESNG